MKKTKTTHPHQKIIEEIIPMIKLSSMDEEEKNMWLIFLPSMEKEELDKLKDILDREISQLMDIYLEAKKLKKSEKKKKK